MDGRHARRERSQQAVINAIFELIEQGGVAPSVEQVGARAGVSVATIFRHFGSLDELARQMLTGFRDRFGHLFRIAAIGKGPLTRRIARLCDARLTLYEAIWPFVSFMAHRAARHDDAAANLERIRALLSQQVRRQFEAECRRLGAADREDLIAAIDTLTSAESWALQRHSYERSRRQIKRSWEAALGKLLSGVG